MGETRVDLQHLLEDLRDAYTGALEETIVTEMVANALDSGATHIRLVPRAADATLAVVDNGSGMRRRDLARYHDVAATTKSRGEGIGFAGVGIKLGLLVSTEVLTETRRGRVHVATRWHLSSRHRAPWRWVPPPGLAPERGTAVQLVLQNQLSPLLDAGYLEEVLRRHFEPLLDDAFGEVLRRHYRNGVLFEVDGRRVSRTEALPADRVPVSIRLGRRRTPSAVGFVERHRVPLPDDRHGIAVSTYGKVIKRGWDWLGLTPSAPARISGLVEAPDLAACLTLNKNDFVRTGPRGATYLAYRKAIQEVISRQLAQWGDAPEAESRPRTVRLERDLERVIEDLAEDFPLLRSLVDRRPGGQKRLPLPGRGEERVPGTLFATLPAGDASPDGAAGAADAEEPREPPAAAGAEEAEAGTGEPPEPKPAEEPSTPRNPPPEDQHGTGAGQAASPVGILSTVPGRRRPARYGLLVQFEARPEDVELARLVDSTVWINEAHPAYTRAMASRSTGYHLALAVALALAPLAADASSEHQFITQFLAHWGSAQTPKPRARSRRRR